jgi:hypothetical protein
MRYKAGSRCTIVYQLGYGPGQGEGRNWPAIVVAKAYAGNKGANAYAAMRALWDTQLRAGDLVTIAEPLAYLPDLKVLLQGPIVEQITLEELLRSAVNAGTPAALAELDAYMRKAARGLAALHTSGARYGETITWEDELDEVRGLLQRLAPAAPQIADALTPLLVRLKQLADETPPDPTVPVHRAFRPAQVLLNGERIGFIDFDGAAQSEPALDLALFVRKARALGLNLGEGYIEGESDDGPALGQQALLERAQQMQAICETFLAEYEQHAPASRQRIALWEALDLLTLVIFCWTKVEPQRLATNMLLLEQHLREMEVL